jgi:hypothetical protein
VVSYHCIIIALSNQTTYCCNGNNDESCNQRGTQKALEAVIMTAARDVIELKKAKKTYHALKDTCRQYDNAFSIHQLTYAISKMEESDDNEALLEFNPNNLSPISELTLGSTFDTSTLTESSINT